MQHYTKTEIETAALAANAGICLEDSNVADNTFSKLGDAINNVNLNIWDPAIYCQILLL